MSASADLPALGRLAPLCFRLLFTGKCCLAECLRTFQFRSRYRAGHATWTLRGVGRGRGSLCAGLCSTAISNGRTKRQYLRGPCCLRTCW